MIIGAFVFSYFLAITRLPEAIVALIVGAGLPGPAIIAGLLLMYVLLGAVFDEVAAMVLTLPVVLPIIVELGHDPIWWGIVNVVVIEIGMICPPIGINVFVLHGMAKTIPLRNIYRGILPFLGADLVRLAIIAAFPPVTLALVEWVRA
jgi:TRAP-type C4-dicarboxylate transport system permease large subunit